jgi:predicted nucleic acid-binding protein
MTDEATHEWSKNVLISLGVPVYTSESVLTEVIHLLRKRSGTRKTWQAVLDSIEAGVLRVLPVMPVAASRIKELMLKYYPQMDLADASLVVLSERYPKAKLITIDRRDFTVYRRKDGNPVPPVMPPE